MTGALRAPAMIVAAALVWLLAAAQVPGQARLPMSAVVAGAVVTQPFGCTNFPLEPFVLACPGFHFHSGIDLAAPVGTQVRSATAGVARVAFDPAGAGLYVTVLVGARGRILYCHLSSALIHQGEAVQAGEVIGLVGATGLATGPHVHLEVQVDGRPVDPAGWLATQ
ncbi:MAG: M23 family metallopeptidase [Candidatus Dormibacterales bacterium]